MTGSRVALFCMVAATALSGCGGHQPPPGPLAASVPKPSGISIPRDPGRLISLGFLLDNSSSRPMTLDAAGPVDQSGPREVVRAAVLHHPRSIVYGNDSYPPSGVQTAPHPLRGWVVRPHERDDNLIFEIHVKQGVWLARKVKLAYHSGADHYVVTLPFTFKVCSPEKRWRNTCSPPP